MKATFIAVGISALLCLALMPASETVPAKRWWRSGVGGAEGGRGKRDNAAVGLQENDEEADLRAVTTFWYLEGLPPLKDRSQVFVSGGAKRVYVVWRSKTRQRAFSPAGSPRSFASVPQSLILLLVGSRAQVVRGSRNWLPDRLTGTTPTSAAIRNWEEFAEGDMFTENDVRAANAVCVIGETVRRATCRGRITRRRTNSNLRSEPAHRWFALQQGREH